MLNADTGNTYVVPTYGTPFSAERVLNAHDIEFAGREHEFDLSYEEAPREWHTPEQKRDTMPESVVNVAGETKAPDVATEMGAMSPEQSIAYIGQITHVIPGIRREALTLAA